MEKKSFLSINVLNDDNGELHFAIEASNGLTSTGVDFYAHREDWKEFSTALTVFPASKSAEARFEYGKDETGWAYYFLLRAFCYDRAGHSALEVVASESFHPPKGHRDRFFIELKQQPSTDSEANCPSGSKEEWASSVGNHNKGSPNQAL